MGWLEKPREAWRRLRASGGVSQWDGENEPDAICATVRSSRNMSSLACARQEVTVQSADRTIVATAVTNRERMRIDPHCTREKISEPEKEQ